MSNRLTTAVSIDFDATTRLWTARTTDGLAVRAPGYQKALIRITRVLARRGDDLHVEPQLVLPPEVEDRIRLYRKTQEELCTLRQLARDTCHALVGELLDMRLRRADVSKLLGLSCAQLATVLTTIPTDCQWHLEQRRAGNRRQRRVEGWSPSLAER